jgi:spore maturation protein CgeB
MSDPHFRYVFLGLSITSSWGNGHATTYRALLRQLDERGHQVTFLERDLPFYAANRDLPNPSFARTELYGSFEELVDRHRATVREADLVVVGSYVPEGARIGAWVQEMAPGRSAFYDIDTPITVAGLARGDGSGDYLTPELVSRYPLYLSFTGGPTLERLRRQFGATCVRPLYCSADPDQYHPADVPPDVDLGYLGTYSADRQPALQRLLVDPAQRSPHHRFVVAGAQYPDAVAAAWPANVRHTTHVDPSEHRRFYASQRFTLNVTRQAMVEAGWSPSVRLFEAAACGTPVISDPWPGLDTVFEPGREILVASSSDDVVRYLRDIREEERRAIGAAARSRFLKEHTAMHRAEALERYTRELLEQNAPKRRMVTTAQTRLSS